MDDVIFRSVLSTMPSEEITCTYSKKKCELFSPFSPYEKRGKWIRRERTRGGIRKYVGVDEWGEIHTISVDERTHGYDLYCSECGKLCSDVSLNFCSNCGVDMRGDEDERVN